VLAARRAYADQLGAALSKAWGEAESWAARLRAALAAALAYGEAAPAQLRFLLLDAPTAGRALLAERRAAAAPLVSALREGRPEAGRASSRRSQRRCCWPRSVGGSARRSRTRAARAARVRHYRVRAHPLPGVRRRRGSRPAPDPTLTADFPPKSALPPRPRSARAVKEAVSDSCLAGRPHPA